jgi:hypothetical protein
MIAAIIVVAVVGTFVFTALERRRHRKMAVGREALTEDTFISQMAAAGVANKTAKFVWDEAIYFYFEPLRPDPSDRWEQTMQIDPEDLEDTTALFWKQQGWKEPTPTDPVILPKDPSLLEYALWLDRQRPSHP